MMHMKKSIDRTGSDIRMLLPWLLLSLLTIFLGIIGASPCHAQKVFASGKGLEARYFESDINGEWQQEISILPR